MNFKNHPALAQYTSQYHLFSDTKYDYWVINVGAYPAIMIIMGPAFYDYTSFMISTVEKLVKAYTIFSKLRVLF